MTRFALYGSLNYASIFTDSMAWVILTSTAVQLQGIVFLFWEACRSAFLLESTPEDSSFQFCSKLQEASLDVLHTKLLEERKKSNSTSVHLHIPYYVLRFFFSFGQGFSVCKGQNFIVFFSFQSLLLLHLKPMPWTGKPQFSVVG